MSFHVAPRYTPGSPAMVDTGTAMRVAKEEQNALPRHLEGVYGADDTKRAKTLGLDGIVYETYEKGGRMYVYDIITDKRYRVPLKLWGASAPDGQDRWHCRTDREQFLIEEGGTRFERHKQYQHAATLPPKNA